LKTRTILSWGGVAAVLLILAGSAFAQSAPQSGPTIQDEPGVWLPYSASTYSDAVDYLYRVIFWVTLVMFLVTEGLLLLFCIIYRRRPGHRPTYTHGNNKAEITWTIVPALMLLGLAIWQIPTWNKIKKEWPVDGKEGYDKEIVKLKTFDVLGEQYKWNVRYPGTKAKYKADADLTNISNIHMPLGSTALFNLRSKDVIHSLFIPHMRVKQDTVPGLRQKLWFKPNRMFLKRLKEDDGKPTSLVHDGGKHIFVKEGEDWVRKPLMIQPSVFVYADDDKLMAPTGCLRAKDYEEGGKLWDKKIAMNGHSEKNGVYEVPVINGVAKKVQILHKGKLAAGALADCDFAMGIFEVACAELCGLGHYTMRAFLYVDPPAAYEQWLKAEMDDVSDPLPVWKYWRD
jgi:cytochrome c oxidase subunit II